MPSFEDELGRALRRTSDGFSTDQQRLADSGRASGRRTLRRRRAGAVTGSVAALALVGAGGAWAGGLIGGTGGGTGEVAAPAATQREGDQAGGKKHVTSGWMTDTFKGMLPPGELTEVSAGGVGSKDGSENAFVFGAFDDKKGKATVSLNVWRAAVHGGERDPAGCPVKVRLDSCRTEKLPDGSQLRLSQGYEAKAGAETKRWSVTLYTPGGFNVDATATNSPGPKGEAVSRPNPPLDLVQLQDIVTDGKWRTVGDALPPTKPTVAEPTAEEMTATLAALLPKGLELSDEVSQPGHAAVVVNDGKGGSLVQVNAQPDMGRVVPVSATTLPDGTKVVVTENSGDKDVAGTVMLTVDTARPDGRRVVISAFNSATQRTSPTRPRPALTAAQLKAIALSPDWWK